MYKSKALLITTLIILSHDQAFAVDQQIGASITMRSAISVDKNTDINFGMIDYMPSHQGTIQIGTDNTISFDQVTGLATSGGTPTASDMDVVGAVGEVIDISCDSSATLSNSNGDTLPLSALEFAIDAGVPYGDGVSCTGLGQSVATVTFASATPRKIFMGGELTVGINGIASDGVYTSALGSGPVKMRFVYQ